MTSPSSPPLELLIVDDDSMMRLGLTAALSSQDDFEILGEATDGRQGIEQAAHLKPDVVLMDVGMPGMDGIEAAAPGYCQNLREGTYELAGGERSGAGSGGSGAARIGRAGQC